MPNFAKLQTVIIGDVKVTYLPDGGGIVNPLALYPASTEAGWQQHRDLLNEDGKFLTTIGAFLIEAGDRKIAIDQGIGPVSIEFPGFGPFFGEKYLDSLKQTGIEPEAITDVFYTHLHLDHCGWTTREIGGQRQLTFANARYMVTKTEWDFWYGGDNPAGPDPEFVQKPLEDRIEFIRPGDSIVPGIEVLATPGHTPGHVSLQLSGPGERLFLLGDVLHGAMQLEERDWSVAFDVDVEQARKTREGLYPELVKPNTRIAANHFSNAVFGSIVETEAGLRWHPLV